MGHFQNDRNRLPARAARFGTAAPLYEKPENTLSFVAAGLMETMQSVDDEFAAGSGGFQFLLHLAYGAGGGEWEAPTYPDAAGADV